MGRARQTAATLGWSLRKASWCWDVPAQEYPLHFVKEPLRQLQHRVWDSHRRRSSRWLEARCPVTIRGLAHEANGQACRAAMRAATMELEKSLLRGLMVEPFGGECSAHARIQLPAFRRCGGKGLSEGSITCIHVSCSYWATRARCTWARKVAEVIVRGWARKLVEGAVWGEVAVRRCQVAGRGGGLGCAGVTRAPIIRRCDRPPGPPRAARPDGGGGGGGAAEDV